MSQLGLFDVANRYAGLDARNDPLLKIDRVVPWEEFHPHLKAVLIYINKLAPQSWGGPDAHLTVKRANSLPDDDKREYAK